MPMIKEWTGAQQRTHHQNVGAVLNRAEDAIRRAKAISTNYTKLGAHVAGIANTTLGGRGRSRLKLDSRLHVMLSQIERLGRRVYNGPVRAMSKADIRAHNRHLKACLPLLRENAEHAAVLSRYWQQMHGELRAVVALLK
jgi:hypothetical protein